MKYLNREWALNFIFYFCDSTLPRNALLVTDHPPRLEVDFSFFDVDMRYCFPERYKGTLTSGIVDDIVFFSSDIFPSLDQKFQIIIIDLENMPYRHLLHQIINNLDKDGSLIVLAWSRRMTTTLSRLFWHLGFSKNRWHSLIENQVYDIHGLSLILNWYFFVVPSLHKPRKLVRRGFKSVIPEDSKSNIKGILNKAGLFYLKKHHRIIIGKMNTAKPESTFLEQLLDKIQIEQPTGRNDATTRKSIRQFTISGTKILILDAPIGDRQYIMRFPLNQTAADRIQKQVEIVRFLNSKDVELVPKAIDYVRDHPFTYYVEEKIEGETGVSLARKNNNNIVPLYNDMLHNVAIIHNQFGENLTIDDSQFKTYFLPAINTIVENTKNDCESKPVLDVIKKELSTRLNNKVLMRSICHGDLKIENGIFDSQNKLKGIFDWDMSEREGITITDVACLLATSIRIQYYKSSSLADFIKRFKGVPEEFIPSYTDYFEATRTSYLDPQLAILYYWIDRVYKLLRYHYDSNKEWIKENINPVLDHVGHFLE
jgi:thiamine kinase-like enzyme